MNEIRKIGLSVLLIISMSLIVVNVGAVAPSDEAIAQWKLDGTLKEKIATWNKNREAGWCKPSAHPMLDKKTRGSQLALGTQVVDTINVIVILVDFTDQPYTVGVAGEPYQFDSILFSDQNIDSIYNPTGSMTDFYMENSNGTYYIQGDIYGWYTMPQTYAYYVGSDDGGTYGSTLARHAADAAETDGANFSKYDNNLDGRCDGLIIIHSGRGAEEGAYGIWSHKSQVSPTVMYDNVLISDYTMNPEETGQFNTSLSHIGVFCHEFGHFIGLPDLYDWDYNPSSSDGLGRWGLMSSGNYLGGSKKPAHMCAWSKEYVGFLQYTDVTRANLSHVAIPAAEFNPVAYRLIPDSTNPQEYWVVENRQKIGFDLYLPTSGLAIYHIDEGGGIGTGNVNSNRYLVALEQADGNDDLALTDGNIGDGGDLFPGAMNVRAFNNLTIPGSWTNDYQPFTTGVATEVSVWNISNSDSIMFADLDLTYSRPYIELSGSTPLVFDDSYGGDGDGLLEAGETIAFYCTVKNFMRESYNVHATLQTTSNEVTFTTQTTPFNNPNPDMFSIARTSMLPIIFTLSDTMTSSIDSFTLVITTDSLPGGTGSGEYVTTFTFEQNLGAPQVLIVDDDRGKNYQADYEQAFYRLRVPTRTWGKQIFGTPSVADLSAYNMVFWITGDSTSNALNSSDIASMKGFMNNGGSLMLTSKSGAIDLWALDSAFVQSYFKCSVGSGVFSPIIQGVAGSTLGDGLNMRLDASKPQPFADQIELFPLSQGEAVAQVSAGGSFRTVAVSHKGSHASVLMTFGLEYLVEGYGTDIDSVLTRTMDYFGGMATDIYDGSPFHQLPRSFDLSQNYPNPFNPTTTIRYTLRNTGNANQIPPRTELNIYNLLGQHVKTLVDQVQVPGQYEVEWNGTDRTGQQVATGIYFYRLVRGDDAETRKMLFLK